MRHLVGAAALLLLVNSAVMSQNQPGALPGDDKLTCAQIADQLVALTGGVTNNLVRTQELMASGGPDMVQQTITGLAVGTVAGALPGPAGAAVASGAAQVQAAEAEAQRRAAPKRQAELQALEAPRAAGLDRMLRLHEMHEARYAASPAK
jgi:hypothetical protein